MTSPPSDAELATRQAILQAEARELLAAPDLAALLADIGPPLFAGSFVSGLMSWREVDAMVLVGPDFTPKDVVRLLDRIVGLAGVTGLEYRDERGPRCATGQVRDERYHVPVTVDRAGHSWQLGLSLWLHDPHHNVTRWHEELRERITGEQRRAVLRIKNAWHRWIPASPSRCTTDRRYARLRSRAISGSRSRRRWRGKSPRSRARASAPRRLPRTSSPGRPDDGRRARRPETGRAETGARPDGLPGHSRTLRRPAPGNPRG